MNFAEWITSELNRHGWSRREAARRGGFSASILDKVINGYSKPGIKFLQGLAKAFDISLTEVISHLNDTWKDANEETINLADWFIGSYKYPETRARALAYLEFLKLQEEKGEFRGKDSQNIIPTDAG
jgi:transcriptional regulator with XRE-family HTH domain